MFNFLLPDFYFHSVNEITPSFLEENGIKAILFDIDNTLEPYASALPSKQTIELFDMLSKKGIKVAIISNNHEPRVKKFCAPLGVEYSYDSGKPSSKKIKEALSKLSVTESDAVIVGDQLFTDMWAASNSGIRGVLVDRISSNEGILIKLKRILEYPLVAWIRRNGSGKIK